MSNYLIYDSRQIAILFVWLPFFTIPFALSQKRIFYWLAVSVFFLFGFFSMGSWILLHHPLTSSGIFVLFNTNLNEAVGFAHQKWSYEYLLIIPYLFLLFLAFRYPPSKKKYSKKTVIFSVLCGIILLSFATENAIHNRFLRKGTPTLVKTIYSYQQELKGYRAMKNKMNVRQHKIKASSTTCSHNQVSLLILGESTNRNHLSLYGYYRNTSSRLEKWKDLIVYKNVISGYSHTMQSVPTSLSYADLQNKLSPANTISIADVYDAAGFKTFWLSNQPPIGVWDNIVSLFAQEYDHVEFVNQTGNSSFEALNKYSFDSKLFTPLKQALALKEKKKFIVLHLMGAHGDYYRRFPPSLKQYNGIKAQKSLSIANYDNAIAYNDYVVDSLLKIFKNYCQQKQVLGSVIYISDHGENVYDVGDNMGHDYTQRMPKCLVEIPFLVWLSPLYKNQFPKKTQTIINHQNEPFVTDDLFHALIDISNIKTTFFIPQKSIFNPLFNNHRKRILVDGFNYDAKE